MTDSSGEITVVCASGSRELIVLGGGFLLLALLGFLMWPPLWFHH